MLLDDLRNYLQMASGLTEATTAKARDVVSGLVAQGLSLGAKAVPAPEMMGQVQELADDLVTTSKNNREMLVGMIRSEVDRAVGRMGFVREDEFAALRRHVQRLEQQLTELQARVEGSSTPVTPAWPAAAPVAADHPPAEPEGATAEPEGATAEPAAPAMRKKKIVVQPEDSA